MTTGNAGGIAAIIMLGAQLGLAGCGASASEQRSRWPESFSEPEPPPPAAIARTGPEEISAGEGRAHLLTDLADPRFAPTLPKPYLDQEREFSGRYRVCVDPRGAVFSVTPLKSSGQPAIDEAWMNTIRRWSFRPWHRDDQPQSFCYPQQIDIRTRSP